LTLETFSTEPLHVLNIQAKFDPHSSTKRTDSRVARNTGINVGRTKRQPTDGRPEGQPGNAMLSVCYCWKA